MASTAFGPGDNPDETSLTVRLTFGRNLHDGLTELERDVLASAAARGAAEALLAFFESHGDNVALRLSPDPLTPEEMDEARRLLRELRDDGES